ncbi:hypothetical protein BKG82_27595 [Mycobacteroides chelonae]|uniref:Uncharacterized protein n=1 Tax=Mycobacteroides chelonae TaxID=1774 RepID=A0A1S1LJ09_MYCCH|nr:hypothetical protein [Mycobacteroides chelonae]OHU47376.1 hypothetical protein BKG82_27595 [Mycobacteroides chelonae]
MSGYNEAHGDTAAVALAIANDREASEHFQSVLDKHTRWDGKQWQGISPAAAELEASAKPWQGRIGEIKDADFTKVSWTEIVASELQERNIEAGRNQYAGLAAR